ncbi:tetratricopeptide repeat protein [Streptomyces sp. DSM 40750]|uniref:tetratricopeptide repeat protein n=1 Tax=Streptomyces sp. DSM 40750 TaxID=2801030 RepID=UPI00214AF195|nr:tetratricopeptide repeat protein [Streptomyces sp. DSM 40750]UUU19169.1 tetratricopeptide repeat protein [Streptomyces sp. DSM 40750]UUU27487.1 tetratricopeptide repeat protein [Streptomyces sp. DSM 40750]
MTGYSGPAQRTAGTPVVPINVSGTGDAIAATGGLANSGYIHELNVGTLTMVLKRGPREPAAWPHQIGLIPPRALSFQPRAESERLEEAVRGGGTAVLTGMGGVGKTQLAADYAHTAWQGGCLDVLVWISASNRSAVISGYAQAGVELCGADASDPEQAARMFLAWLHPKGGTDQCRWLITLDDVSAPADLRGLWPPASPHGHSVVTTRRREAALSGHGRHVIGVGLFTEAEAVAHLTSSLAAHDRHEPTDQLVALASDLGHLPLALSQATAYLVDAGLDCRVYRRLLADRAKTLTELMPETGTLPDDQEVALSAAWSLSIERADRIHPVGLARPMLQLAAMLSPNGIPGSVLGSSPALAHLAEHRARTAGSSGRSHQIEPYDAVLALRVLHRLSLIKHTPATENQAVRVHQLIQRATRESLPSDQHDDLARTAGDALVDAWPEVERDSAHAQILRANTEALNEHAPMPLWVARAHPVLFRAGKSLGEAGLIDAARSYWHELQATAYRSLGSDHPDSLTTSHYLAFWQGEAGDAAGAAAAFAELLGDRTRILGPDHPSTLNTRANLAYQRGEVGDAAGAAAAFAELLEDRIRVLGPDHPDTLITRGDVAGWRGTAGDVAGAVAAYAELLKDRQRVLGPDHPNTLNTRGNLAYWRGEAGDAAGALSAYTELLEDRLRVLGPDHPHTLTSRHNVARWRGEMGDAKRATTEFAELLKDRLRILGPDHPRTLKTRSNLARWQGEAGDPEGAASAFAELLTDALRVLGPDHPETLKIRASLARWQR